MSGLRYTKADEAAIVAEVEATRRATELNAARRWWLDHKPWEGHVPTDAEVLEAYAKRGRTAVTGCEHYYGGHQIPCPPMCPMQQWPAAMFRLTWFGRRWKLRRRYRQEP